MFFLIYNGCNALKGQEMDLNQSRAVGGNIVATTVRILKILLLGHFLQMFCMKCVLCVKISRPVAKLYEYITFWLISSRIANC